MHNQRGFTFVEILISVSLFVVLVFGMFQFSIIATNYSKKTQAQISLNQILYNIKTAVTSSIARRFMLNSPSNPDLSKCALASTFNSSTCKALAEQTASPYAKSLVLLNANNEEIAKGDTGALTTVATRYDELGTKCNSGSPSLGTNCPIFAQAFYKTLCIDSSQSCGNINDVMIIIHYRIFFDPLLPASSPYKTISPNLISSLKTGWLGESDNPTPQLPLLVLAGYFNF